jgi:hypothetical protein
LRWTFVHPSTPCKNKLASGLHYSALRCAYDALKSLSLAVQRLPWAIFFCIHQNHLSEQ